MSDNLAVLLAFSFIVIRNKCSIQGCIKQSKSINYIFKNIYISLATILFYCTGNFCPVVVFYISSKVVLMSQIVWDFSISDWLVSLFHPYLACLGLLNLFFGWHDWKIQEIKKWSVWLKQGNCWVWVAEIQWTNESTAIRWAVQKHPAGWMQDDLPKIILASIALSPGRCFA